MPHGRVPGEEPPFVSNLLMQAGHRVHGAGRGVLARVPRQVMFALWGGGAVAIAVLVLVLSVAQSPTVTGVLSGLFVGLFTALLYAAAMGWLIVSLYGPRRVVLPVDAARETELERLLAPTMRELDAARTEVIRKVKERSVARVPAGVAIAVALWGLARTGHDPPGLFGLLLFAIVGALGGEVWAIGKLDREYRRLYKERVLPHLARRFGDLTYRHAVAQQTATMCARRILQPFERAKGRGRDRRRLPRAAGEHCRGAAGVRIRRQHACGVRWPPHRSRASTSSDRDDGGGLGCRPHR